MEPARLAALLSPSHKDESSRLVDSGAVADAIAIALRSFFLKIFSEGLLGLTFLVLRTLGDVLVPFGALFWGL